MAKVELTGIPYSEVWGVVEKMRETDKFGTESNFHRIGVTSIKTDDPNKREIAITVGYKKEPAPEEKQTWDENVAYEKTPDEHVDVKLIYRYSPELPQTNPIYG